VLSGLEKSISSGFSYRQQQKTVSREREEPNDTIKRKRKGRGEETHLLQEEQGTALTAKNLLHVAGEKLPGKRRVRFREALLWKG